MQQSTLKCSMLHPEQCQCIYITKTVQTDFSSRHKPASNFSTSPAGLRTDALLDSLYTASAHRLIQSLQAVGHPQLEKNKQHQGEIVINLHSFSFDVTPKKYIFRSRASKTCTKIMAEMRTFNKLSQIGRAHV